MVVGGAGACAVARKPRYKPVRHCRLCRKAEKKHPGCSGRKVILQGIPKGAEWFGGKPIQGLWCKACQGMAARRGAGKAQPPARSDVLDAICMPVSPKCVLEHNGASATPIELLAQDAKYVTLTIDGETRCAAMEAVGCGGTTHLLRSGCLLEKKAAAETKRKARAGYFVPLEPRREFFAVHSRDAGHVLGTVTDVHGRMVPVGLIYARTPEDFERDFKCARPARVALLALPRREPRSNKKDRFKTRMDALTRQKTKSATSRYSWERASILYNPATTKPKREASGKYFFVAPAWLPHKQFTCVYKLSKGQDANGYTDGIFKRVG